MCRLLTSIAYIILVSSLVCAGEPTLNMSVVVLNSPPTVGELEVTKNARLSAHTIIWCNASISDPNGFSDIERVEVLINNRDTSETLHPGITLSQLATQKVYSMFELGLKRTPGDWTCRVEVVDEKGLIDSATKDFIIYLPSCMDEVHGESEVLIDCGGDCPPCLQAGGINMSIPVGRAKTAGLVIESTAHEYVTLSFSPSDFNSGQNRINQGNLKIMPENITLKPHGSVLVYPVMTIPDKTIPGDYAGTLDIDTNTSAKTRINVHLNIIKPEKKYMRVGVEKSCVHRPSKIIVADFRTPRQLINLSLTVRHDDEIVFNENLSEEMLVEFTPRTNGLFVVTADKQGYVSEEVVFDVMFCALESSCTNGLKDAGEVGVDCGGDCYPCHCFDGLQNNKEDGIDCGGPCESCPVRDYIVALKIRAPKTAIEGESITLWVFDELGMPVDALLKVFGSGGEIIYSRSVNGTANITLSPGGWSIQAFHAGNLPAAHWIQIASRQKEIENTTPILTYGRVIADNKNVILAWSAIMFTTIIVGMDFRRL